MAVKCSACGETSARHEIARPEYDPAVGNRILCNSIFHNTLMGIDLEDNGVTENDAGDADIGANGLQNFPVLSSAFADGSNIYVSGSLNSEPVRPYLLQFFWGLPCDANNHGEGQHYMGQKWVTTDSGGNVSFAATFRGSVPFGQAVTATATSTNGSTSEFSICGTIRVAPTLYIARSGSTVTLMWQASYGYWILQRSPVLATPAWVDDPNPVFLSGGEYFVTEAAASTPYIYRLRSP